jgi:hypothetical protein
MKFECEGTKVLQIILFLNPSFVKCCFSSSTLVCNISTTNQEEGLNFTEEIFSLTGNAPNSIF